MPTNEPQSSATAVEPLVPRQDRASFLLAAVVLTALAAGMGWGIRGQYGHESGAMIAGALASLTLVLLFVPGAPSLTAARAAAMMTVAIGIGGSMTYGQTVGLTHDNELLGNWAALRWGMLGLLVKGSLWIGFGGVFLGMGLGGKRYRSLELAAVMAALVGLMFLGIWLINSPFDPASKTLPRIYFSDNWYFEPGRALEPRREIWGGYLLALVGLIAYVRLIRGDRLAARMALVGMIAGGLGFPGGQSVQAFQRWNPEVFTEGMLGGFAEYFRHFNWWNMMETTFGMIWGSVMALGLWLNRRWISIHDTPAEVTISPPWEVLLCVSHVILLLTAEFLQLSAHGRWNVQIYIEFGLIMSILPMIGIVGGRFWPYLMLLPIVAAPVAGKTLRMMSYDTEAIPLGVGWLTLVEIPMGIMLCAAVWLICRGARNQATNRFAAVGLLLTSWLFFGLNTVVFDCAWPWKEWTGRTANQVIFSVCTIALTMAAVVCGLRRPAGNRSGGNGSSRRLGDQLPGSAEPCH
ncbi:MAG: hypothetical protein A2W31_00745 [Planctomycetes bacterium RBG_16_64_10]|nr:MAG: hypothetical protein A2W31_00745 [Planctomycetes bacterium RBG_16_64_10]